MTVLAACLNACQPGAEFYLSFKETENVRVDMFTVTVTDGQRSWTIEQRSFDGAAPNFETPAFRTATKGKLIGEFELVDADAMRVSEGMFELHLRSDWRWHLGFRAAEQDPTSGCFGCMQRFAFPLVPPIARSVRDSFYLVVGGNTLDNSLVF